MKRNLKSRIWFVTLFAVTILLFACSSDGNEDNGNTPKIEKTNVSGIIEKGPFVQGAKVTLYELDADLSQTGKSFRAQTNNDLGAFLFETSMSLESQYVELETSGYFYNEVKGNLSTSQITLNALSDVKNRNSVNVNLITHLEFDRVKKLVHNGKSFSEAKRQAEKELLACFAITDEITSPEGISITDNNKNSAILLAISTVMLYEKSEAEFTEFIAKFSSDFADNGKIDNSLIRTAISEGEKNAHPKEVIERMKEFYANKGVTMECDDFSKFVDFNGDGVIDENDKNEPINVIVEEFWTKKEDVLIVLNATYNASLQFATSLLKLEGLRTDNKENVHSIKPQNSTLSETYQSAYKAINCANTLLYYAPNVHYIDPNFTESDYKTVVAEAKCLRAFAYYNLAMLWGNVILITQPSTEDDDYTKSQSRQSEVYQFVYSDICDAITNLPSSHKTELETKARFTRNAGLMLKAEIELTLGRNNDAKSTLSHAENTINFGFITQEEQNIPVYTSNHLTLFKKEAEGNTNELVQEWAAMTESRYGYWAALKRLGKAQEMTGCFDYELLMPFPSQELRFNPKMIQNPGY